MSGLQAKKHQIRFPLRLCPRSGWGRLQRYPRPLDVFNGPTSKGTEGRKGKGERVKGFGAPKKFWRGAPYSFRQCYVPRSDLRMASP